MKKFVLITSMILVACFCLYYFHIRTHYLNNLHTSFDISEYQANSKGIEQLIDDYIAAYHIPGLSAAIIKKGEVDQFISRGYQSRKKESPINEHSIFQIASTSKTLTGIICRSMELEGKIDLDKSIASYLADELSPEAQKTFSFISLRQVITHRSGLGRSMYAYSYKNIIDALETVPLEFPPGSKYQYSNFGYALVTMILEQESKKTYKELLVQYVMQPFGIDKMYCSKDDVPIHTLVTPYWKHFRLREGPTPDFGTQIGASGVFTDTESLAKLASQQLQAYQNFDSLKTESPLILTFPKDTLWSKNHFYGYGFFEFNYEIKELPGIQHSNLEHGGDLDGFATIYDFYAVCQCGIIINTSSGGDWINDLSRKINNLLLIEYYRK